MCSLSDDLSEASDEKLVELSKKGATQAFDVLVKRHWQYVVNVARQYTKDAEDIAQVAFVEVWRKIGLYSPVNDHTFIRWLLRITEWRAIDSIRRAEFYNWVMGRAESNFRALHQGGNNSHNGNSELLNYISAAMNHLPVTQAEVLELVLKGYSHREIATKTGIPVGTIKTRIKLVLQKLRQMTIFQEFAAS